MSSLPSFTCEDIRQYYYCKRKIFFRYVLRARVKPTYKMLKGSRKHEEDIKRGIYANYRVLRNVYLRSERLGLIGVLDLIAIDSSNNAIIVELKYGNIGSRGIRDSHKAQLACQSILVEDVMGLRVRRIEVLDLDTWERRSINVTQFHRNMVTEALNDMRSIVMDEILPDPPENMGKCVDCEYRKFCWDLI